MGCRARVRVGKPPDARNRAGKLDNAAVRNLVEHWQIANSDPAMLPVEAYIGTGWTRREPPSAGPCSDRSNTMPDKITFAPPGTATDLEEGLALTPKFHADGLVTAVATDAASGEVLMVAHMNAEALSRTIATGEAWYFSRSRGALWKKGETSGHAQRVLEMRVDCDQDAILIK